MRGSKLPVMVPVEEKNWDTMVDLLEQVVLFQPEQIKALQTLATKDDLSESLKAIRLAAVSEIRKTGEAMISECKNLKTENENIRLSMQNLLSQVGKNQEQFINDSKEALSQAVKQFEEKADRAVDMIRHRPLTKTAKILLWILGASEILHLVWSVLQQVLFR